MWLSFPQLFSPFPFDQIHRYQENANKTDRCRQWNLDRQEAWMRTTWQNVRVKLSQHPRRAKMTKPQKQSHPPLYLMSLLNIFGVNFLVLRAAACVSYAHAIFIYISSERNMCQSDKAASSALWWYFEMFVSNSMSGRNNKAHEKRSLGDELESKREICRCARFSNPRRLRWEIEPRGSHTNTQIARC